MKVPSLCPEDCLEEGMTTHLSILAWRIPWTEEPGGLQFIASLSQTQLKQLSAHTHIYMNTSLSLICQLKGPRRNDTPAAKAHLVLRS